LIKHYRFGALLFVVTGRVGGINTWDSGATDERLLDWSALRRLRDDGVEIGSHSVTHPRLTGVSPSCIAEQGVESRAMLQRELGINARSFAYPWGDEDEVVRHLIGASGYDYGLSCRPGLAARGHDWLALPRVEVTGFDTLSSFIAKLAP
jgi:peptidoglycan/xylan/chitin deacetylase (PgdA/CDA1 family)